MRRGVVALIIFLALSFIVTTRAFSEAIPIEYGGLPGFFLSRPDMEAAVMAQEERDIYKESYEDLKVVANSMQLEIDEKDKRIKKLEVEVKWVGIGGAVLCLLSFVLGATLR